MARCIRAFLHDGVLLSIPEKHLDLYREDLPQCFNFSWSPPADALMIPVPATILPVQVVAEFTPPARNWGELYRGEG